MPRDLGAMGPEFLWQHTNRGSPHFAAVVFPVPGLPNTKGTAKLKFLHNCLHNGGSSNCKYSWQKLCFNVAQSKFISISNGCDPKESCMAYADDFPPEYISLIHSPLSLCFVLDC